MSKTFNELREFLSNQALHRYNHLKDFNKIVSDFLGFEVEFEEFSKETWFIDDRIGVNLSLENDNDVYVDVFYITDNDGNMVITEFIIDTEHALKDDDLNKKIGVYDDRD